MTDDEEGVIAACSILLRSCIGAALTISENNKRKHKTWVNEYVAKRHTLGTFNTLLPELLDAPKYFQYLCIDVHHRFHAISFSSSLALTFGFQRLGSL